MAYDLSGYRIIDGTTADELLVGTTKNDAIYGNGGADTLSGAQGADLLVGGGSGTTFLYSADSTWSSGYAAFNAGDPTAPGSGGRVSLSGYGRSYDVFVGTGTDNVLMMPDGKNALFLDDGLSPGVDNVRLAGIQTIQAGNGGQIIDLTSSAVNLGDVRVIGGTGNDYLWSNAGNDTIEGGAGNDTLEGGAGRDWVNGGAHNDLMHGGDDNDALYGGGGNDRIYGDAGDDKIWGDGGNDTIQGGAGNDLLAGGQVKNGFSVGNDTFVWEHADVVDQTGVQIGFDRLTDFGAGDRLDFSGLFTAVPSTPAQAVMATDTAEGTVMSADFGLGFMDIVLIEDAHGLDIEQMLADGSLVV